jgi:DUF4097 and DUF4098 domain-containing protein YvlB
MKRILILLLPVLIAFGASAQDGEPFINKSFSKEAIDNVYARTSGGSISVQGGDGPTRVEVFIKGNNNRNLSESEIKERILEDYKLVIKVEDNELRVTAEPKDKFFNWRNALNISFKLYVPVAVSTDLETSGGSISMRNLSGAQNFSTSGGSLRLDRLSGRIKGRTSGGSIEVKNTKDQIDLSTSGGSIDAENCNGTMSLSTSGGSIKLDNLNGRIRANTSGGPIRGDKIKGELTAHTSGGSVNLQGLECSVDASTSGGSMDIQINKLEEYVTVHNSGGNINLSLPANKGLDLKLRGNRIHFENMQNFSGNKEDDKVDGKINGGGIPVNVQTSGRVSIALN